MGTKPHINGNQPSQLSSSSQNPPTFYRLYHMATHKNTPLVSGNIPPPNNTPSILGKPPPACPPIPPPLHLSPSPFSQTTPTFLPPPPFPLPKQNPRSVPFQPRKSFSSPPYRSYKEALLNCRMPESIPMNYYDKRFYRKGGSFQTFTHPKSPLGHSKPFSTSNPCSNSLTQPPNHSNQASFLLCIKSF